MLFATATALDKIPPEMQAAMHAFVLVVTALLPVAVVVFWRLLRRVENNGPLTRPDLFKLPDLMAITVVFSLIFMLVIAIKFRPPEETADKSPPEKTLVPLEKPVNEAPAKVVSGKPPKESKDTLSRENLINNMLGNLLPAMGLLAVMKMRGGSLRELFGLNKVSFLRALGMGLGMAVLAIPLVLVVKYLVVVMTNSNEAPQKLIQEFSNSAKGGDIETLVLITISAVIVAPLSEEIMFRGCFYPLFTRVAGRIPAAFFTSVVFALVHDTYTDAPSLTVLALLFVLAYEATGSLLVPIFMHAGFNGLNVLLMLYGPQIPT